MDYSGKIITKNPVEPSQTSAPGVWTLDQATQAVQGNNWPIAYVPNPISRSLRFNPADTAYLSRTFGTPTNNKKWTMSGWMKRSAINDGNYNTLFSRYVDGNNFMRVDLLGDNFRMYQYQSATDVLLRSTLVLRDPSAWYHFVVVYDSDNATPSSRVLFYINNTQITSFSSSTYPGSGTASIWNTSGGATHQIGTFNANGVGEAFSGYMTETNFIDGQALDPTYFGMTDPRTGAWIPKKYSGTYGTNGFYLNFSDNSTTAALGTDYSGNSNTWTTNNFSVTTGSGNDSMVDVPTPWIPYNTTGDVGGVVRGNYATRNPLAASTTATGYPTNGNLDSVWSSGGSFENASTMGFDATDATGYYWEYLVNGTALSRYPLVGVANSDAVVAFTGKSGGSAQPGSTSGGWMFENASGNKFNSGSATSYGTTTTSGWGCVAVKNGKIFIGSISGGTITWKNSGNPITEANPMFSGITGTVFPTTSEYSSGTVSYNFGQQAFQATPPAGFKSLCTTNLSEPTILDGGDYFNAVTYDGNGTSQTITTGLQPDFIWIKRRNGAAAHVLTDNVRGTSKQLFSNLTDAEQTDADSGVTAINSTSMTLGDNNLTTGSVNGSGSTYVAWNWKANGSGSSNTAGTITSTVSVNQTAGFSIATYTGDGSSSATFGHGLGSIPKFVIIKARSRIEKWCVSHTSLATNGFLYLNLTDAASTASTIFQTASFTSSVVGIGDNAGVNNNTDTYVAYCFAPIAGYSAFGSYTGNGSTDGPFVYTGFRARYILIKRSDSADDWFVYDTARSPYNAMTYVLSPNSSAADTSTTNPDDLSNGFKIRSSSGGTNASGGTYIYAAFAENPFKYSNAR